jgi:endonuclease III
MNTSERAIRDRLVEQGRILFDAPKEKLIELAGDPDADALLNDLDKRPHAFVLACLMDRQVRYKKAWLIPYTISQRMKERGLRGSGEFSIEYLSELSLEQVKELMSKPDPPHWLLNKMSGAFRSAVHRIKDGYASDASRIWKDEPSSAEAVYRFLQFDGAGPKIATMAVNILARDFKIKFADRSSIDISPDVQVRRVFARLGLCPPEPTVEQVMYKARALYPDYPGVMDSPCWDIGEYWCKTHAPRCNDCCMKDLCPKRV